MSPRSAEARICDVLRLELLRPELDVSCDGGTASGRMRWQQVFGAAALSTTGPSWRSCCSVRCTGVGSERGGKPCFDGPVRPVEANGKDATITSATASLGGCRLAHYYILYASCTCCYCLKSHTFSPLTARFKLCLPRTTRSPPPTTHDLDRGLTHQNEE